MKYPEERHARELHRALQGLPGVTASVEGEGVHWHCDASRGERSCRIHCFNYPPAEYAASFDDGGRTDAAGRTRVMREVVDAVAQWLAGGTVRDLYHRFGFVDRLKRALEALAAEVTRLHPALSTSWELQRFWSDSYQLWFTAGDRSCEVSFYGVNESPDARFHWDECELFRFVVNDTTAFAAVLARWLCDRAMPSALRAQFPWLQIGPLADSYEAGRGIEGEFLESWDWMERYYRGLPHFDRAGQVVVLIAAIRAAGFDRKLRGGQSLYNLIVSRSRRHGLRQEQPCVAFVFEGEGMQVYVGEQVLKLPRVEFDPRVEAILRDLAAQPID